MSPSQFHGLALGYSGSLEGKGGRVLGIKEEVKGIGIINNHPTLHENLFFFIGLYNLWVTKIYFSADFE